MPFNIGGGQLLVILLVALIVLGPDKLPEAARTAAKAMRQVRDLSAGFQQEMRDAMETEIDLDAAGRQTQARRQADVVPGTSLPPAGPAPKAIEAQTGPASDAPGPAEGPSANGGQLSGPASEGAPFRTDGPSASFS